MIAIKFGDIVHLHIILDSIPQTAFLGKHEYYTFARVVSHAMTGRSISIVLAPGKVVRVMILELLLEWQRIKLATKSKLSINFFLADVEVLHIEKSCYHFFGLGTDNSIPCADKLTNMLHSMLQLFYKLFLATGLLILAQIEGNKLCPVH